MHEPERETVECRNCEAAFNLAAQHYYDNLCPPCKEEEDPQSTWPGCPVCNSRFEPGTGRTTSVTNPGMPHGTESITVCSLRCVSQMNTVNKGP